MTENSDSLGRKVFFLHPPVIIQNQVIDELAQEEFEVYAVKNEIKLRHMLKRYPGSIVFASICDGMKETAWEEWIKSVLTCKEISGLDIGILTSMDDGNTRQKYMGQFQLRGGYTVIRPDPSAVIKQLASNLNGLNAKGRRKYIRAITENEQNITVNLPINGTYVNGSIRDISTVGFSCSFVPDPELEKNSLFTDLQVRLKTQLIKVEGMVFGSRMQGGEKIYVILFPQHTSPDVHSKIRRFIHTLLQSRIENEF